jgi:hypothetical protein
MQSPSQNIFLLRSPLYIMDNCTQHTAENAREKYSGYAIAYMKNTRKAN